MQTHLTPYQKSALANSIHQTKQQSLTIIIVLLILLWSYTAGSKLIDLQEFKRQLYNQTFGINLANLLLWLIPITEITAALLLIIQKTRLLGLTLSLVLMSLFTGYIALVLLDYYERTPCSCGGVLQALGWEEHFYFNLFFFSISIIGIYLQQNIIKSKLSNTNS
jgi:putative oxidoreductase